MFETKILDVQGDHYMKLLVLFRIASYHFMVICFENTNMDMRKQKRKVSHYHCLYIDFHYDINQYTRLTKQHLTMRYCSLYLLL